MKILIDGDACSRIKTIEKIASKKHIPCHIYCDTSRYLQSDYSTIHLVDVKPNSADMAIINNCENGDVVVTNDSGLAAMILTRKAFALNNAGMEFTDDNIMSMLTARHIRQERTRKSKRKQIRGVIPNEHAKQRTSFGSAFKRILERTADEENI